MFKPRISDQELKVLPKKSFNGTIYIIQNENDFETVIPKLEQAELLGFDTETRPSFKKGQKNKVALLQLSTDQEAFLFRLNNGMSIPDKLINILENEDILKAGVAIKDDLRAIRQRMPFHPRGFIELQEFVKDYEIEDNGLRKLAGNVLHIKISKRQQLSNWENPILTDGQIRYAATDAWVCYKIYETLMAYDKQPE
ncbi:MAG: 3'-5' exonuclease domain-containing protein 2 [Bacteroidetes bacterium]|jgi:ribonuclease D|nr:3'-5' exonuclease domain-containing protein 2 [Bacteroidota bacterium]